MEKSGSSEPDRRARALAPWEWRQAFKIELLVGFLIGRNWGVG
jgi:hypothetical protein